MHFDFAALLVILTALTGIIWAADALVVSRKRKAASTNTSSEGGTAPREVDGPEPKKTHLIGIAVLLLGAYLAYGNISGSFRTIPFLGFAVLLAGTFLAWRWAVIVEYAHSFFPVILAVLCIRSFMFEPFRIPSSSMVPTLLIGDFILVNKFSYGVRLPVLDTKILDLGGPERGDVVVFRYPCDPSKDYIKRVIGLPGDTIQVRNKHVWINGEQVQRDRAHLYDGKGSNRPELRQDPVVWNESLAETDHLMMIHPKKSERGAGQWKVPEGHYFVMGDNRDRSEDSRFWGCRGIDPAYQAFVPEGNLVGKAILVWMHFDLQNGIIGWSRLGESI